MKIAFLTDRFPAISETFIENQIVSLLDLGVEVTVLASGRGSTEVMHEGDAAHPGRGADHLSADAAAAAGAGAMRSTSWRCRCGCRRLCASPRSCAG